MIGLGTKLEVNDGASNAQTEITSLVSITPPNEVQNETESKTLGGGSAIGKVNTLVDRGKFTFDIEYSDALYVRLLALKSVEKVYRITLPSNKRATFTGCLLSSAIQSVTADAIIGVASEVSVRSAITWDTAS